MRLIHHINCKYLISLISIHNKYYSPRNILLNRHNYVVRTALFFFNTTKVLSTYSLIIQTRIIGGVNLLQFNIHNILLYRFVCCLLSAQKIWFPVKSFIFFLLKWKWVRDLLNNLDMENHSRKITLFFVFKCLYDYEHEMLFLENTMVHRTFSNLVCLGLHLLCTHNNYYYVHMSISYK